MKRFATLMCVMFVAVPVCAGMTPQQCRALGEMGFLIAQQRDKGADPAQVIQTVVDVIHWPEDKVEQVVDTVYKSDLPPAKVEITVKEYCLDHPD